MKGAPSDPGKKPRAYGKRRFDARPWVAAGLNAAFVKSVGTLFLANVAGQGIVICSYPFLARLFSPSDFGILAVYSATISLFSVAAALRYELSIPLPRDDQTAAHLLALSLGIVVVTSSVIAVITLLLGRSLLALTHAKILGPYLWLIPIGFFGAGCYQVIANWAIRQRKFGRIARAKLAQGAGQAASQLLFGLLRFGPLGLLLGDFLGQGVADATVGAASLPRSRSAVAQISLKEMRQVARRYRRFPLFSSWAALLNTGGIQLPPILFAILYGTHVAGWLSLSWRAVLIPAVLIGEAVSQVYAGTASRLVQDQPETLPGLFYRTAFGLLLVGLVPAVLMAILGPEVFRVVFGNAWRESGVYVQILSVTFLAQFVAGTLSRTLTILERQHWQLAWDATRFVVVVGTLLLLADLGLSSTLAVAAYSGILLTAYLVLFVMSAIAVGRVRQVVAAQ